MTDSLLLLVWQQLQMCCLTIKAMSTAVTTAVPIFDRRTIHPALGHVLLNRLERVSLPTYGPAWCCTLAAVFESVGPGPLCSEVKLTYQEPV